ncbi:MAG: hypothetical protein F9B45_00075 [Phycisphaera sp. RhM]|nr:hypothetical protein [Phycisphaera sp. RhM]
MFGVTALATDRSQDRQAGRTEAKQLFGGEFADGELVAAQPIDESAGLFGHLVGDRSACSRFACGWRLGGWRLGGWRLGGWRLGGWHLGGGADFRGSHRFLADRNGL